METKTAKVGGGGAGVADGGRFAPYVVELREFFTSRGMGFGAPEDLAAFAQALREPGTFREELASLTRSVVYREQGKIAITELLQLMTVAMGGARIAKAAEAVREPVRELLGFLGKAMRGRAEVLDGVAARDVSNDARPVDVTGVVAVAGVVDATADVCEAVGGFHPHAATEFYSRARSISMGAEDESLGSGVMSGGDSDSEPSLVPGPATLVLRPTVSDDAKHRSSRVERGLFACAVAGVVMAAVMFVHPRVRPAVEPVGEPMISAVGPVEGAAAGGASDVGSGAGIPAGQSDRGGGAGTALAVSGAGAGSGFVGRGKPAAGEPMLRAAVSGGPTRTSSSIGSLPSQRMGVYTVSSSVMAAKLISAPAPEYPKLAGLIHMEGEVTLQTVVSRNGKVVSTHVLRGHRLLRGAASDAVRQWRYRPYLVNGQAADVATTVTVNFRRR
jgi:TonB family protein